ncbi:putative nuclease HARBI1 [Engraulis encrasicolus]|uniref:putative nuclease HARBI1 n=1 Tax=Engraulis encrasicolus TaxID=184585 RepID=UPI002FCEFC56
MAALFMFNQRRRRRRSEATYVNAFIRVNFDPLHVLTDEAILRKYCLCRPQIEELVELLTPHLQRPTRRSYALSPSVQLLAALRFYASGSLFEVVGDGLGMSRASISRSVTAVTELLLRLLPEMAFPTTPEEIARTNRVFHAVAGIPRVIGVVDGTLVPIARPTQTEHLYVSRKGFHALNVQVVCDGRGVFTDIVAKWPDGTHDAFMWANSGLCQVAEGGDFGGCWLLGDSGYPLRPFLLTPHQQPNTDAEARFNGAQSTTRAIVERSIGVWKQRFRCVSKTAGGVQLNPTKCCSVVVVTALLHNMALRANVPLPEGEEMALDPDLPDPPNQDANPQGLEVRARLVRHMFGP